MITWKPLEYMFKGNLICSGNLQNQRPILQFMKKIKLKHIAMASYACLKQCDASFSLEISLTHLSQTFF